MKGNVAQVDEKAVIVSIPGAPFDGIVPISELSSLHIEKASDAVSIGDELELMITKVEDENFVLSKRKVDALKAWETLEKQFNAGEIFEAEVKKYCKRWPSSRFRSTWFCSSILSRRLFCRFF